MKRVALSLAVIAGSAAYVLETPRDSLPAEALLVTPVAEAPAAEPEIATQEVIQPRPPVPLAGAGAAFAMAEISPPPSQDEEGPLASSDDDEEGEGLGSKIVGLLGRVPVPRVPATPPIPRMKPRLASGPAPIVRVAASPRPAPAHADGTFVGSVENAYYGLVQVQAQVAQGKLVSIKVLRYPSDRRTSVYINSRALPLLKREAITAQSANVDIVSGATLTSRAFARSLDVALNHAGA